MLLQLAYNENRRAEEKPLHIIQPILLSFNDFFKLEHSGRLRLVLETINAEKLLLALEADSPAGPKGYPARALWSALIAGVVYRIPTIAELIRNLESNPYLQLVCGMPGGNGTECSYFQSLPLPPG